MDPAHRAIKTDAGRRRRTRAREPSRERGLMRFNALLDATEALLEIRSPDDVGLYQIAEAAGVPPASAYHFFPTKEAIFVALVKRYLDGFAECCRMPFAADRLRSWQDLMRIEQERARAFYGAHPAALKLLCGGFGGLESRRLDAEFVASLAEKMYERYDSIFYMPYLAEPTRLFHVSLAIMDAIWSLSYLKLGRISEEYAEEALSACIAYCRLFLPERVDVRQDVRELAARGAQLCVPIG